MEVEFWTGDLGVLIFKMKSFVQKKSVIVQKKSVIVIVCAIVFFFFIFISINFQTRSEGTTENGSVEVSQWNTLPPIKDNGSISNLKKLTKKTFFNETTCSHDAYLRSSGQKIVSFSFFKNSHHQSHKMNLFLDGIKRNLDVMPMLYPGWIMRVYINLDVNDPTLADLHKLISSDPNIDLCDVKNLPRIQTKNASDIFGSNWRFLPALDPQVRLSLL